jgi:hypothetical protein
MSDLLTQAEPVVSEMRNKILADLSPKVEHRTGKAWTELARDFENFRASLEESDEERAIDLPSAVFLKLSASLLAIYRTLLPIFSDRQELLDLLGEVLFSAFYADGIEAYLQRRFGVSPEARDDAWDQVCRNFVQRGEEEFGQAWTYEQGVKDRRRCFVNIRKCGFADFLLAHDARDLLYVICAGDYVWADALEDYDIRLERPTLLAEGSDACRFQFFKVGA